MSELLRVLRGDALRSCAEAKSGCRESAHLAFEAALLDFVRGCSVETADLLDKAMSDCGGFWYA